MLLRYLSELASGWQRGNLVFVDRYDSGRKIFSELGCLIIYVCLTKVEYWQKRSKSWSATKCMMQTGLGLESRIPCITLDLWFLEVPDDCQVHRRALPLLTVWGWEQTNPWGRLEDCWSIWIFQEMFWRWSSSQGSLFFFFFFKVLGLFLKHFRCAHLSACCLECFRGTWSTSVSVSAYGPGYTHWFL